MEIVMIVEEITLVVIILFVFILLFGIWKTYRTFKN